MYNWEFVIDVNNKDWKIVKIITNSITIIIVILMRDIIDVLNWKDNENVKDKKKENVITIIIENVNVKNDMKLLRTIIGNQIEIVNENKDIKNDKNVKGINNKKLIRTIIGIFNWKMIEILKVKNIKKY